MNRKFQVGVIGLGKFGHKFGKTLAEHNIDVVGVDARPDNVKQAQDVFTQVYQADATNKNALEQLGFADMTHVLISVGSSIAASSMIALYLKELQVPNVWAKAINSDHEKLLLKIGVDEVFIPERMAAKQLANRLAIPGFIEYLPFDSQYALKEFMVQEWAGKTLRDIDLTNRFNVQVIAVKHAGAENFKYIPKANEKLNIDDTLVAIGEVDQLKKIKS
jgi:trk system potassium uptake protein TrkA